MDTLWAALDMAENSRETVIYTVADGAHAGEPPVCQPDMTAMDAKEDLNKIFSKN